MKQPCQFTRVVLLHLIAANLVWAADPVARRLDTVTEMLALKEAPTDTMIETAGYWRAGDQGGGLFRYIARSTATADGGSVLRPEHLPGRFLREAPADAVPHAEWFGARGDGEHEDHLAINSCLRRYGKVKLLAKTYAVGATPARYDRNISHHSLTLWANCVIEGSGRDVTLIKLRSGTNPRGASNTQNYFSVISNADFHQPADNVVIRDLTIDGNFDGQNRHSTIHAISIRGGNALVERLNLRGYGTGWHPDSGSSQECFVISQRLVYKNRAGSRKAATLRDLDFTAPGQNGSAKGTVAEITHMVIGGAQNFGNFDWIMAQGKDPDFDPSNGGENERNWWPSEGGLIENCRIHDIEYDPRRQKSYLHGITMSNTDGAIVRSNRVENFDGTGFFTMSWHNRNTTIVGNTFSNVASGISIQAKGIGKSPVQFPKHQGYRIENNHIILGAPKHLPYSPSGIQLFGGDIPAGPRLVDIIARNNTIEGRSYTDAKGAQQYPIGINVQVMRDNLEAVRFENNTIEIPHHLAKGGALPREPYGLAVRYFPLARWQDDARAGKIVFQNNKSPSGRELRPALANWNFNNAPTWGRPDGSSEPAVERR